MVYKAMGTCQTRSVANWIFNIFYSIFGEH
jgi:hypothetical protein